MVVFSRKYSAMAIRISFVQSRPTISWGFIVHVFRIIMRLFVWLAHQLLKVAPCRFVKRLHFPFASVGHADIHVMYVLVCMFHFGLFLSIGTIQQRIRR